MRVAPIEFVLFDLGGVLVELDGVETLGRLAGMDSMDALWDRWLTCPWVARFERGECDADAFATGVVGDWGLPASPESFLELFRGLPVGPYEGAVELVHEVRRSIPVGCLSNTNALHWHERFSTWPLLEAFDETFLSFQLGAVKPDPAVFEHVADDLGLAPESIAFIDDNTRNVDGATKAGLRAFRARGTAEAREALVALGVVRQPADDVADSGRTGGTWEGARRGTRWEGLAR